VYVRSDLLHGAHAREAAVPWLALAVSSLLMALMTAIGRFGFGVDPAFASRYITFSSMFWIGTFGALCALFANGALRLPSAPLRFALGVLTVFLVGSYTVANHAALQVERLEKDQRLTAYRGMLDLENADNLSLSYSFPDPNGVRDWTRLLQVLHEGPFR
jgi:hypothetical protein